MTDLLKPVKFEKGDPLFSNENIMLMLGFEIATKSSSTIIKRNVKKMNATNEEVLGQLSACTEQLGSLIGKWNDTSDKVVNDMKTKVSKIKDVQGQLVTSIANVQKTVTDAQLERLVNNAERLASALSTISELNKNPNVATFIQLMKG